MKWGASNSKSTDYIGNRIYENSPLKRILVDGGYIEGGVYYYYLQDHLDNNRVVANANGAVVQTNHYYPFGMAFAEGIQNSNQPFKYNGKELDSERALNLYDYIARCMDAALGRFTTVDPLAEKYYSWSPYAYCGNNNPINAIDPNGEDWYTHNDTGNYYWREGSAELDGYTRNGASASIQLGDNLYFNAYQNAGIMANKAVNAFDLISSSSKLQNQFLSKNSPLSEDSKSDLFNALNSREVDKIARPIGEAIVNFGAAELGGMAAGKLIGWGLGKILGSGVNGGVKGGRVFWSSGGNPAVEVAAREFAIKNGMTTLEMTRAG